MRELVCIASDIHADGSSPTPLVEVTLLISDNVYRPTNGPDGPVLAADIVSTPIVFIAKPDRLRELAADLISMAADAELIAMTEMEAVLPGDETMPDEEVVDEESPQ